MSKKKDENTENNVEELPKNEPIGGETPPVAAEPQTLENIKLTVKREHCITPHAIELRRNGTNFVVEARTEDFAHSETIGAKTIAQILQESGRSIPKTDNEELEINISPYKGAIISITKKIAV